MAKAITDQMIVRAALKHYAIGLWYEAERGGRYFGLELYADLIARAKELYDA